MPGRKSALNNPRRLILKNNQGKKRERRYLSKGSKKLRKSLWNYDAKLFSTFGLNPLAYNVWVYSISLT
jgi:hypothetical protein